MSTVLASYTDSKGRTFQLVMPDAMQSIQEWGNEWLRNGAEGEEYNREACVMPHSDEPASEQERIEDEQKWKEFLNQTDSHDYWVGQLQAMPTKKNGTLSKGRVSILARLESYSHYWEDSYCWVMPGVRIKAIDDLMAQIELDDCLKEKY